jgi:hypothetical protein
VILEEGHVVSDPTEPSPSDDEAREPARPDKSEMSAQNPKAPDAKAEAAPEEPVVKAAPDEPAAEVELEAGAALEESVAKAAPEESVAEAVPEAEAAPEESVAEVAREEPRAEEGAAAEPVAVRAAEPVAGKEGEPVAVAAMEAEPAKKKVGKGRRIWGWALTAASVVVVFLALIMPNILGRVDNPGTWVRIPIEGFVAFGLILIFPAKSRRVLAAGLGVILGVLSIVKMFDMGFYYVLARAFDPVLDWVLLSDAREFLRGTYGRTAEIGALIAAILLGVASLVVMALASMRIASAGGRHWKATAGTAVTGTAVWVVCLLTGVTSFNNMPVAARASYTYAIDRVKMVQTSMDSERDFAREVKIDAFAQTPPDKFLTSLKDKDVLLTFVESYGRSAIEDPTVNRGIPELLDQDSAALKEAGYSAKSGWLTSPTLGGGSWLAHSTLLSGLWINTQARYRNLMASDRLTLTRAFQESGFDTKSVMPGATRAFPEAGFYGYNDVYDSRNMGYQGPKFGWGPQPDQYTMSFLQKNVQGPAQQPLFVEMPLVSSHTPWWPLPQFINWEEVGDGSIYDGIREEALQAPSAWKGKDPAKIKRAYNRSVQYTITTVSSYLEKYGDDDTVMILLGDHQPSPLVVGDNASHDVPITILAKDPKVLEEIADWNWTDGLRPARDAPVWPMNQFRDRFLTAYGSSPDSARALGK